MIALLAEHNVGALIVSADGTSVDGIVSERTWSVAWSSTTRCSWPGRRDHDLAVETVDEQGMVDDLMKTMTSTASGTCRWSPTAG